MKKKLLSGILALIFVIQIFVFGTAYAKGNDPTNNNLIKIGELTAKDYPKIDPADLAKLGKEKKEKKFGKRGEGATLFSTKSPYIDGQQPADPDKPKYWANVEGKLTTVGLDGGTFDWNKVLGQGAKVKLLFTQTNGNVMTGVTYTLLVDKDGTYTWQGSDGKPTYLPLYDVDGNPYTYNVQIQRNFSENVQLIIQESNGTPKSKFRQEGDKQVATISFLDIGIQQVASTKFVSEWHTALAETDRPQIEGYFEADTDVDNDFNFPKNDKTRTILRSSFVENFVEDEENGPWSFLSSEIEKTPKTVEVKTDTQGLTFEEKNGVKTVKSGDHKFKYDFTYDVINGGKLTMTEIIPVTFDANGGKFENFTAPDTETKIVKEVEYDGTLTDKAENPTKQGKAFKGWATDANGTTPATDSDYANLKSAKTFYAIWSDEDIQAEELVTSESLGKFPKKGNPKFTNDFVPTFEDLKAKVKVKDANGDFVPLPNDVKFSIVDDKGTEYDKDSDDLKKFIYEKVKENNKDEVSRTETVKAKITYDDGTTREIEIPIKVLKNIYKGTDDGNKYPHIPDDYVKVTIDPTDKAQDKQKTYYYVNPKAKVIVPVTDPVGAGENKFSKWTMKADSATGDGADYAKDEKHQFPEASTITAQYGTGIVKIAYVDQDGNKIDDKYKIAGQDYPSEKSGGLGKFVTENDFAEKGPDFKGYVYSSRDSIKGSYQDPDNPNVDTFKYYYYKRVTTKDPNNDNVYFKVVFDANDGKFGADTQKTLWVYMNPGDNPVTFEEARAEIEGAYGLPTKDAAEFIEWQDKAADGSKVADDYVVKFPGWDWEAHPDNGYVPEVFYAHYGQASAKIAYLDLNGKPIADDFKIDGVEYPTEKAGTPGEAIASDVFTKDTAPKLIGYKFNRIELNPANAKYAMDNKATIKIYYEKLPDVIPAKDGSGNPNEKPDGYVEVKFVPTDKAKDTTEKIFYVNPKKDVTIPIANPEAKATYTFKEWKMGANADGAVYTPSAAQKFTEPTTVITATYEETKNIIPYDPSVPDPMARPEGYVKVTFAADPGLKLTEQKAYYVKKNAGITLGSAELVKPAYEAQTGYKFDKWDKEDSLAIEAADIVVTANAKKLDNVIPEKKEDGTPNEKPEGYKEVTFVVKTGDEAKGSIDGVAKFYVNPTEYVTINPPATSANTGYEFGAWDKDATIPTVYKEDATITGSFNELKAVIPKTNPDGTENKQPAGYKKVEFVIDPAEGGKIADKEVTVYYVNPAKEVTVPQPKTAADTGYVFEKWDQDTSKAKKYEQDTTVKGNFKKLDDIIPSTDDKGDPNAKPEGYVTVTFDKGEHGKEIKGQTVYYVNPKADPAKTLGDKLIVKPEVKAEVGYKFTGWDTKDDFEIKDNKTVIAQYETIDDVIPKENPQGGENEKPEGYITVTFDKGANGKLEGNTTFYVNPNKAVVLEDKAPTIKPNTGYTSAGWDTTINKAIQYKDGDKITALYNELGDVIPQEKPDGSDRPAGYLTVTFDKGANGQLSGKTVYYVKPNKEVTVPAPSVTPDTGYKQKDGTEAWDKPLTQTFTEDTKITAQYAPLENVIPQENKDGSDKPKGYVTVTFKADANGSLLGTTVYYVNPNVKVDLTSQAEAITKNPNVGYTAKGGTWDKEISSKTYTKDEDYTFNFAKLNDIIPGTKDDGSLNEKPDGYVTVKFVSNVNGILEGQTVYYVNPNANKTMSDIKAPTIKANDGFVVKTPNWNPDFSNDLEINKDMTYAANYDKLCTTKIRYKSNDESMGTVSLASEDITSENLKGSTATAKDGYEFVNWTDENGKEVSKEANFIPSEKLAALYIAVFRPTNGTSLEVEKIWPEDMTEVPTMNFTLYRKVADGAEEKVSGKDVIEITKTNTSAKWENLPEKDSNGNAYTYFAKESFKDLDAKNDNWILGQMVTDKDGKNTISNKLKTIPGQGETPDQDKNFVGKLTIKKVLENEPATAKASMSMMRAPKASDPLKFKFKVTGPYGYESEEFELAANETKTLENLAYGEYKVEEIDSKGYTAYYSKDKETLTKNSPNGTIIVTNKNIKPADPQNPNQPSGQVVDVTINKVWKGGKKPATTIELWRKGHDLSGNEYEQKVDQFITTEMGDDKQSKEFKDLAKHDPSGREFVYYVKEENVPTDYTASYSEDGLTVTNTYQQKPTPDPDKPTPNPDNPTPDPDKPTPNPDNPTPDPDKPTPDPDKPTPNPDGEEPGTPGEKPEPKPGKKPGEKPGDKPGEKPGNEPEKGNKVVIPDKTGVKDKNHLTDEEKKKIIDKIKKVNPDVVDVVVDKKGNATLIYENGKKHTIPSDKLIYQIKKDNNKVSSSKTKKMKGNPRTSVSSISVVVATLLAATTGLFVSKKKDEEK